MGDFVDTSTITLVTEVAKAIFGNWRERPKLTQQEIDKAWNALPPAFRTVWIESAHDAIAAMRIASYNMCKRAGGGVTPGMASVIFANMIDEALRDA